MNYEFLLLLKNILISSLFFLFVNDSEKFRDGGLLFGCSKLAFNC